MALFPSPTHPQSITENPPKGRHDFLTIRCQPVICFCLLDNIRSFYEYILGCPLHQLDEVKDTWVLMNQARLLPSSHCRASGLGLEFVASALRRSEAQEETIRSWARRVVTQGRKRVQGTDTQVVLRLPLPGLCSGFLPGSECGKMVANKCIGSLGEGTLHRCSKFLIAGPTESWSLGSSLSPTSWFLLITHKVSVEQLLLACNPLFAFAQTVKTPFSEDHPDPGATKPWYHLIPSFMTSVALGKLLLWASCLHLYNRENDFCSSLPPRLLEDKKTHRDLREKWNVTWWLRERRM